MGSSLPLLFFVSGADGAFEYFPPLPMLGPLQRGIRSFAEAQAESPDFSSGCQMRPIEEGFLNFFFYPVMLYLKYCKILKRRAKVCACSFVLITSPQDSACAEVI